MHRCLIALTVAVLLLTTLSASASSPAPGPFSTTGYTTNLDAIGLPNGYAKLHIRAQGGPAYDADSLSICQALAPIYGLPSVNSCDELCALFGEACGAHDTDGYFEGSFAFDEWAIVDAQTFAGANEGLLTLSTGSGSADMHFGGTAGAGVVDGSFQILGGSGVYKKLAGVGTYNGNSGYVFKVDYIPCGGVDQPACPMPFCAVHGKTLKLKTAKAMWDLVNGGEQPVVLTSLLLFWPEANGALTSVSLGGKTLATGRWDVPGIPVSLTGAPKQDREIRGAKGRTLTLEFEHKGASEQPADYTFQAKFAEGCSAIHVAFP